LSLTDNSDSEQIVVDIFESLSVVPKIGLRREEEDVHKDSAANGTERILDENHSSDDLFAEFNESLLDDLLAV
jgi:hypothetical protein